MRSVTDRGRSPPLSNRCPHVSAPSAARLAASPGEDPPRIPFGAVSGVRDAVDLDRTRDELGVDPLEGWVDRHLIGRLPGSRHAGQ